LQRHRIQCGRSRNHPARKHLHHVSVHTPPAILPHHNRHHADAFIALHPPSTTRLVPVM